MIVIYSLMTRYDNVPLFGDLQLRPR